MRTFAPSIAALSLAVGVQARGQPQESNDPLASTWVWLIDAPRSASPWPEIEELGPPGQAFAQAAEKADPAKPEVLVAPALAARLSRLLLVLEPEPRAVLVEFLANHSAVASEVAWLLTPDDDLAGVGAVLTRLVEADAENAALLAPLAAALAVVHDKPLERTLNENRATGIDPVAILAHAAAHQRQWRTNPREAPAELLVYVADATGSPAELAWAFSRYKNDPHVGNRFQEINYDTRAFRQEAAKRVTEGGAYSLEAIRELGGVCIDQAYFAASVGKAIGVPTVIVTGRGGEISHAWVGFIESSGRRGVRWNFDEGRYEDYEDVRGTVVNPQTGERIPDGFLVIQALSAGVDADHRRQALALVDAQALLAEPLAHTDEPPPPELTARRLDLLRAAITGNTGCLAAWRAVREIASSGAMTLDQKRDWAEAIDRVAGAASPDFAFEMFMPLFDSEADPASRLRLWEWAADRFSARPDLTARSRLAAARALEAMSQPDAALAMYRRTFFDAANNGPFAIDALDESLRLLGSKPDESRALLEEAWKRLRKPSGTREQFLRQSNWFQVGTRLLASLEAAGNAREAGELRRRLFGSR